MTGESGAGWTSAASEVSGVPEPTDKLLAEAAVFLAEDQGSPGFLDRFAQAMRGDPRLVSQALDLALAAQARAGRVSVRLEPGDLRVETTSSGASLTACALATPEGSVAATARLVDADRRPVAGAALQVNSEGEDRVAVTNPAGWVRLSGPGRALHVRIGGETASGQQGEQQRGVATAVIELPRRRRADRYELAAAHEGGAYEADEPARWRVRTGGVEFLCLDRKGGYDLTVLVTDVPRDFADAAVGTYAVDFLTWGRNGRAHRWMVPLAPSPLGLAGSLYGTDEDRLDPGSVEVRVADELIAALGDQLDEVIVRSVRHMDTLTAWAVLCQRMGPGRPRAVLKAALAEHENFS
jgi:hypothetical protein